jgi:hypothetical protein
MSFNMGWQDISILSSAVVRDTIYYYYFSL